MVTEILEALLKAALPLGVFSFLMFRWSLKSGRLQGGKDHRALRVEMKALRKTTKSKKAKSRNPLHNKWMKFGGGFYGLVGLWTFLVIEALEIYDFVTGYEGMDSLAQTISATSFIGLAMEFLVNSFKNFITAIIWPGYWPNVLDSQRIWIWAIMAYVGYRIGLKLALQLQPEKPHSENT